MILLFKKLFQKRLFRFILVSGLNTAFGYGLFALLYYMGLPYSLALLLATILGVLFNFKTTGVIVFKNKNNLLVFRFFAVYGITYLGNLGGLALLVYFGVDVYIGQAVLLIPSGLFAFMLNKLFVFRT